MNAHPHIIKRLIRNNIFRLSLLFTLLFFIASVAMLGLAYFSLDKNMQSSIEQEVNAEISRFVGNYQSTQLGIKTAPYAFFIEQDGRKLAGNLSKLPERDYLSNTFARAPSNRLMEVAAEQVVTSDSEIASRGQILGKSVMLPDQTRLFIGKNIYDQTARRRDILDALTTALMTLLAFGFVGGLVISFQSIKRIDKISLVSQAIVNGDMSQRIPESQHDDDIAELGGNINNMLDKINVLMQNTKAVSNNIAHDLRTPLTRVRASIETIAHTSEGATQAEAERALAETDYLLDTFSSLLRISQVESGSAAIIRERVDVSQLIHDVIDFYEVLAEDKHQSVRIDVPKDIIVTGDKTLLSQALVNIFTNAVKYTPERGNILVQASIDKREQQVAIVLHDSGMGVPETEIDKLTDRFYRLEKHRDTANGSGLGLSMVKAIVHAHNGSLSFSNAVGLKVTVTLPFVTT